MFLGRKSVAARCLDYLCGDDRFHVSGVLTDNHIAVSPTADVAERYDVPVLDFHQTMREIEQGSRDVDLIVSVLYWRKIPASVISSSKFGGINFHPAPLPQYKGCAGYNLAILEGRGDWGVTAHYMDADIDTGDIIDVTEFAINPERETAQSLEAICQQKIEQQFKEVMERVAASVARLPTTPNRGGRYVSRAEMEDMKKISPGDDVARKIRAFWFPPYHGAYIVLNGVKYTLADEFLLNELADPAASSLFSASS